VHVLAGGLEGAEGYECVVEQAVYSWCLLCWYCMAIRLLLITLLVCVGGKGHTRVLCALCAEVIAHATAYRGRRVSEPGLQPAISILYPSLSSW
jgi:hypothetical protein